MSDKVFKVEYTSVSIHHETGKLVVAITHCYVSDPWCIVPLISGWNQQGKLTNNHYYLTYEQTSKLDDSPLVDVPFGRKILM